MSEKKPTIAIVGRPNVGKSSLFNRLVGKRQAIAVDTPRTTRDRIYGSFEWENKEYDLIDTGGLELLKKSDPIAKLIEIQAQIAVEEAELVLFLVDGREGLNPLDEYASDFLRKFRRKVVLLVNKVDDYQKSYLAHDFHSLGFGEPIWMSALHGLNMDGLLTQLRDHFQDLKPTLGETEEEKVFKLAIVGQPNVGKSSLLNRFLKTDRVMVSDQPGTTRDPIAEPFEMGGKKFLLTDTAGIRRVNQLKDHIDKISVIYSEKVIEDCDIALFMLDATRELSTQDKRIAGKIVDEHKPCLLVVNKWDAVTDKEELAKKLEDQFDEELYFFKFCPRIFTSAKTGTKVHKLQDEIVTLTEKMTMRVNTNHLNHLIREAATIHRPPGYKGRQLKIYYCSQLKNKIGTFVFKVNDSNLIHFSYARYLENTIRDYYKFEGIPLKLIFQGKGKDEE